MRKALVLIDYIHDFVDDDGALTAGKPAQEIRAAIVRAISRFNGDDLLILTNDSHDWNKPHPEKKLFPPHALVGTRGAATVLEEEIAVASCRVVTLAKTRYSAFCGTDLADLLHTEGIEKLYLTGVCTDICVLHTAVDAYNLGFNTAVLTDCVASFNLQGHEFALAHFKNVLGFDLVTSFNI